MTSDSQIPEIRTFQFDSAAIGDLSSSVNLFRGDINLSQALLSMPGRVQGDGLNVNVSLRYQSNVTRDAMTWNRDAPTGVAALGWSLPTTYVQLDDGRATTAGARSYSYVSNGTPTPLAREPETPFLLSMDGSLASQLQDGQSVPSAVRAGFVALGVNLSPNAVVTATSSTTWTLQDGDNQQLFDLQLTGAELEAYDGGESYQLFNYAFWKILYYPQYERWCITSENGQRTSFGGLGPETSQGYATSIGNSIEWAVQWTAGAAWTGSSEQTAGQSQYARAWHLSSSFSTWGDSIQYGYNEWSRDSSGLIPTVEQLVGGSGGLPYTKAHYLTSITDVFDRKAVFAYGDKLWSDDTPDSAREYADPHRATPGNDPNAYQDRYETFFLRGVTVQDPTGTTLCGLTLSYLPTANVTSFTGSLYGDTCKRFLTGITQSNTQGDTLPGLVFAYYLDDTDPGRSPGALKSITYPQGGVATYTYTQQSLDVCDRTFEVDPPSSDFSPSTPRVFFGSDYAIVCWYNTGKGMLSVQVYTWLGRWEPWSLTADTVLFNNSGGLTLDSLNAVTGVEFFALSFEQGTNVDVYVFQKDTACPGQWAPATVNGTTTGPNVPTRSYSQTSGTVTIQGGDSFLLAASMDTTNEVYSYDRLTWCWTTGAWMLESATLPSFTWVTANNEYHLFLDTQGNVSLWYLDPTLAWVGPSTTMLAGFTYAGDTSIALVPSDTFVVASNLLQDGQQSIQYQVSFLQWDVSYALPANPAAFTFQDAQEPSLSNPTTWIPQVVNDSLVAVAANLLRFNGQTWLTNSNLTPSLTYGMQQRYAYGPDYAIQILIPGGGVGTPTAQALSFDPDADSSAWTREAATPAQALSVPVMYQDTANWPSAGGEDYLTIGQYLYFRGTATNWDGVVAQSPTDLQAAVNQALGAQSTYQINTESAVDEGPAFQAYYVYDTSDASQDLAAAVMLMNGGISGQPETLAAQRIFTPAAGSSPLPGQAPGGSMAFATYPSSDQDFDHASKILLHRYAGDSIADPLVHYAVTGLSVTDGFGLTRPTAYFPDPSKAACDPTGLIAKYYEVTTYPGTDDADADAPPYGTTVTRYLNGLEDVTGADYYNMLDGLLSEEDVYDSAGTLLSQTQRTWQVYVARAADPTDATQAPLNLRGGFVCQTSQSHLEDGVTDTQVTSYLPAGFAAPYSGQPVSIRKDNTGGSGVAETFTTLNTYAYEVNDAALALHALTLRAQNSTTWAVGGNAAVPVKSTATTYTGWPSVAGADVLVPGVEGSFSWLGGAALGFPFSSYMPGDSPSGWQITTRTTGRDVSGQVTETLDACSVAQSTLYSADRSLPIVRATNASLLGGAWAYLGFESYEATAGWTIQGATVVIGDAHTGSNSLSLPAGGDALLSTQVTPPNEDQTYLLGYWYKTPAGFTPATGAGFTVTPSVDGTAGTPLSSAFQDTGGAWVYATRAIPLTAGQSSLALAVAAGNASSSTVLVDDVLVVPMVSKLVARAYDPTFRLVLSTLDSAGHTLRTLYDDFQRVTATAGPQERVKQLAQHFLSREGSASGAFDPASPNAALTVQPASGGTLETFTTGSEWQSRWLASNLSTNWRTSGGALAHTGSTSDTLAWQSATGDTCALFFEVQPPATLSGALGVTFGGGYQIAYDPSTGFGFQNPNGSSVQAPLASPPSMPRQWLVVFGDGVVLCFGDGQLLFSTDLVLDHLRDLGTVAIFTGPNVLSLRNLAMVTGVRVTLTHQDASGQDRQVHRLWGDDARVSAVIRDAIGRTVAITRMAPASFGAGASQPLLAYRSSFVDVAGFLAAMSDTWEMTGDVADYYQGQSDGPVPRSDDGGYPYFGYRFEASTRQRRLEQGAPGEAYAIHDLGSTQPTDRQTTQFIYGPNTGSEFSNLPDGSYRTDTVIIPTKASSTTLRDVLGRKVAAMVEDSSDAVVAQGQADASFTSGTQSALSTLAKRQPNSFFTSPQSNPAGYVSSANQNPLGLMVQSTDPDTGTSLFLSDPSGRLRFVQPQLDAGEAWFAYYTYDALGRALEEGIVNQAWDPVQLPVYAAQADWPDASVSKTISRTHTYDGDGTDPNSIGKEVQVVTVNPVPASAPVAGTVTITETYGYDGDGNLDEVTMAVSSSSGTSRGTIGYTYDNLQEVMQVTYPDGAKLPLVLYQYNDQGQVISLGSAAGTSDLAAYTYTVDGDVETEARSAGRLTGTYQYASPGWLLQYSVLLDDSQSPSFQLSYGYNADGTVQSRTRAYAFGSVQQTTQVTYAYDAQLRLLSAAVADSQPGNEAINQYDANGNIWSLTQDGTAYSFTCAAGSNQLATMSAGGDPASSFTYGACGSLLESPDLSFAYDPCLKLTTGLVTKGTTPVQVQLAYGAKGGRAFRQASTGAAPLVYFRGISQQALCAYDGSAWTQYVHGPTGLIASVGATIGFPLQDTAHTIWAVVDDSNVLVAQYDYLPFGLQLSETGTQLDAVPFRFMGQELDKTTGLYDFGARLYHPVLRRFCSPDSARQFSSLYSFVGNNPLSMVDPSGNVSTWGRVGIGAGMFAIAAAGLLLSVFSFGLSDMVAGFLETLGVSTDAAAGSGAAGAGGEIVGEGDSLVQQGLSWARTVYQQSIKPVLPTLDKFAGQIVSNTAFGVGESGFQYDVTAGPNASWSGASFRQSLVSGSISGALYGAGSGVMGLEAVVGAIKNLSSFATRTAVRIGVNVAMGVATGEGAQVLTNAIYQQPWHQSWRSEVIAGAVGGLAFGIGSVLHDDAAASKAFLGSLSGTLKRGAISAVNALDSARKLMFDAPNYHVQALDAGYEPIPDAPSGG